MVHAAGETVDGPVDRATAYMKENAGVLFDPDLVARFLELMPEILAIQRQYSTPTVASIP